MDRIASPEKGWEEVRNASAYYQRVKKVFDKSGQEKDHSEEIGHMMIKAYDHILVAETSCNFYWGSRWVHRSFDGLEQAYFLLDKAMGQMPGAS